MSIAPLRRRLFRIFWLPEFWAFAIAMCVVIVSAHADDAVEPAEYIIVSDDDDSETSENTPTIAVPDSDEESKPSKEQPFEAEPAKVSADAQLEQPARLEPVDDEVAPIAESVAEESKPTSADEQPTAKESDDPAQSLTPQKATRQLGEGASFKGVAPGKTTVAELESLWGLAKEVKKSEAGLQHVFYIKPFKQVVATVIDDKVDTLLIHLETPFEPAALTKQLTLDDIEPAMIYNGKGQLLGQAFPERGVLFGFGGQSPPRVAQIVIEPVNSQPFITRAEKTLRSNAAESLADVDFAISIDPNYERAHGMRALVLCQLGEFAAARKSAERAVALTPVDVESRLTLAKVLLKCGDYDQAAEEAERVVNHDDVPPLMKAAAHLIWGQALSAGSTFAHDQAVKEHTAAIKLAESVSTGSAGPVRRAAKELLVDAHLAVAHDIAWGNWQQKPAVVPKWIGRASAFCDNLIAKDKGDECVRLRVYCGELSAFAGMKDAPEIGDTVESLNKLGQKLIDAEKNLACQRMIEYQLAAAMADAMLVAQSQGYADVATRYGQQSLAHVKRAGKVAGAWPTHHQMLGRVYYRLGVIQAIDHKLHREAIKFYDKAVPRLETPWQQMGAADKARQGEMFVSMAVSYWEAGGGEEAVRLTKEGVKLMEQAVEARYLPKAALTVPYTNLANMHQERGESAAADKFTELAARCETVRR